MDASDHKTCTICLEQIDDLTKASFLPCFHAFHQQCFNDYIVDKIKQKKNITCPVCRVSHFAYGDRNYSFIMSELCITVDAPSSSRATTLHNNFVYEASPRQPNNDIVPIGATAITIPSQPTSLRKLDGHFIWYHYRYYIVTAIVIGILVLVLYMTLTTS